MFFGGIAAFSYYRESDAWPVFCLAVLLPALYSSLSRIGYQRNKFFGVAFYIVCCCAQSVATLALAEWVWDLPIVARDPSRKAAVITLLLATLTTLIAIPSTILPQLRQNKLGSGASNSPSLEGSTVGRSFQAIRRNFDDIQVAVRREMSMVDVAIQNLQSRIATQERQLERARSELGRTLRELEEYKVLASLSRDQQEIFLRFLSRQKYQEYVIGFILGIVGSVLANLAFELLK